MLVGCLDKRDARPPDKLILAVPQLPHTTLVHVAAANGYFASEGLEVTLQRHQFGKLALDALLAGTADVAACAETPVVLAVLHGRQLSVLATIETSTENTVLLARADSGITSPALLPGMRVGVARGTNGEFFLDTLLVRHRVERTSVQLVDMTPEEMPDAMDRGAVDAVAIWSPVSTRIQDRMGARVRGFPAKDIYFESFDIVTRRGFVEERSGQAEKLLRALVRAEAFVREHPDQARRIVADATKLDSRQIGAIWGLFDFRVRLDQSLLLLMEEEARWAIRSGLVPRQDTPNFLSSLEAKPLRAVKPDAVQLMK
jgi:ABC-type nitrate/sulfonate/bicarbonate transport system substrate-binding protein